MKMQQLSSSISSHIPRFLNRLKEVEVHSVSSDTYVQQYLEHLLEHAGYYVKIYARVLEMGISSSGKEKENIDLLDYGAGVGLLGIFASFCGFKKVSINDKEPAFLSAALVLSKHFNINNIEFISGGLESGFEYQKWGKPDLLVATDVIEHIYDLDEFLFCCKQWNINMSMVLTTGSNPANRRKVLLLRKLQKRDEWEGNPIDNGNKLAGYEHEAFRSMRKKIILEYAPSMTPEHLEMLTERTRGLIRKDIQEKVLRFVTKGEMPEAPVDPYNTCHPETGSWSERILSFEEYESIFKKHDLLVQFIPGFYNSDKKGLKKILVNATNLLLPIFGMKMAPFIFIRAQNIHR